MLCYLLHCLLIWDLIKQSSHALTCNVTAFVQEIQHSVDFHPWLVYIPRCLAQYNIPTFFAESLFCHLQDFSLQSAHAHIVSPSLTKCTRAVSCATLQSGEYKINMLNIRSKLFKTLARAMYDFVNT